MADVWHNQVVNADEAIREQQRQREAEHEEAVRYATRGLREDVERRAAEALAEEQARAAKLMAALEEDGRARLAAYRADRLAQWTQDGGSVASFEAHWPDMARGYLDERAAERAAKAVTADAVWHS